MLLLSAILSLGSPVYAFCGAYLGDATGHPTNNQSVIAIARFYGVNVLTLTNDVQAGQSTFGLVIPVPPGLDRRDLRLADRELVRRVDVYSAPRLVDYTCEDFHSGVVATHEAPLPPPAVNQNSNPDLGPDEEEEASSGCGGANLPDGAAWDTERWIDTGQPNDPDEDSDDGVVVEDEFVLGEYTGWILTAEDGESLAGWMNSQELVADAVTAERLDELIAAGSAFVALRVKLQSAPTEPVTLTPLQIRYASDAWSLPIRLGAASSAGVQDLLILALNDFSDGRAAIANTPETPLPQSDCLLNGEVEDFSEHWESRFAEQVGLPLLPEELVSGQSGFAWATEFAWGAGACDPCPEGELSLDDAYWLGLPAHNYGYIFTRLHVRYTPDAVTQDLMLYNTGITDNQQVRYIRGRWELESTFPTCDVENVETPGDCYTAEYWERAANGQLLSPAKTLGEPPKLGCGDDRVSYAWCLPLGLALLGLRRRR